MTWSALIQCSLFLGLVLALAIPLGAYIAGIYAGKRSGLARWLRPVELMLHRVVGIQEEEEMSWSQYAFAFLQFQVLGILLVYLILRCQGWLFGNPLGLPGLPPDFAFNTAISFGTNTNWQMPREKVVSLIEQHTILPWWGALREPIVSVLPLNMALEDLSRSEAN